jgi:formamidopyrimidine-DNA glycosylase
MVESPKIKLLYESIQHIKDNRIKKALGTSYTKYNTDIIDYTISKVWYMGKYIFIYLVHSGKKPLIVRTHMMMYGKILVDISPNNTKLKPYMTWQLDSGHLVRWYMTQVTIFGLKGKNIIKSNYGDYTSQELIKRALIMRSYDISHDKFDRTQLINVISESLLVVKNDVLTDFLLDQRYFPGIGNILQQEALFRCQILPTRVVGSISLDNIQCLIDSLIIVMNLLKDHIDKNLGFNYRPILQIYHKAYCPRGHKTTTQYLGYRNRRTTWCPLCQK